MFTQDLIDILSRCAAAKIRNNNWPIDAEDLAQETMLRVYKATIKGTFIPDSSGDLERYCKRSLYTTAVDIIRRAKASKRDADVISIAALSGDSESDADIADNSAVNLTDLADVYEAANDLPLRQRRIIQLYAAGYTLAETAELLNDEGIKVSVGLVSYERKNALERIQYLVGRG